MADRRDDNTSPPSDETHEQAAAGTAKEPLVSDDPLGLGGTSDPDDPSRRPRPRVLALLGEFFRMSRTTAVLLVAFVLLGGLYLLVKEDPVVNLRIPEPVPTEATSGETTEESETEGADESTPPSDATSPSSVPGTTSDDDEVSVDPGRDQSPTRTETTVPVDPGEASPGGTGEASPDGTAERSPGGAGGPDEQPGAGEAATGDGGTSATR